MAKATDAVDTAEKTNLKISKKVEWRMIPEYVLKIKKKNKLTLTIKSPCSNTDKGSKYVNGVSFKIKKTNTQETTQKQTSNKTTAQRGKYRWSNIFNLLSPLYNILKNLNSNLSIQFQNVKLHKIWLNSVITSLILSLSSIDKLSPEGKHNSVLNNIFEALSLQ